MSGFFGGGSKPAAAPPLPPPPPPIPPVSVTATEVQQSVRDEKRLALKKKGIRKTVLGGAGQAGGTSYQDNAGTRTVLGGG